METKKPDLVYWQAGAEYVRSLYSGGDSESAHSAEDDLLAEFMTSLAAGEIAAPQVAAQAIKRGLLDHDRTRWYA